MGERTTNAAGSGENFFSPTQAFAPIDPSPFGRYELRMAGKKVGGMVLAVMASDSQSQDSREAFQAQTHSIASGTAPLLIQPLSLLPSQSILIADDSPDDIATTQHALQRARILNPIQVVTKGEDALSYLRGEGLYQDRRSFPFPVLLLLDWKMPGISGEDVLVALNRQPPLRPQAVVILTGANALPDIRRAYQLGANSFLAKPLVVEDLLNVLRGLRVLGVVSGPEGDRLDAESDRPSIP